MLVVLLVANALLSGAYALVQALRGKSAAPAALFLFLPGLGFVLYIAACLVQHYLRVTGINREAVLVQAHHVDVMPEHPNLKEELNVVPVADAVAVSHNAEKRRLLLAQLKRDVTDTYRLIQAAEKDSDTESTHYIAAAKMEVYRLHQQYWLGCRKDYEEDPTNPELFHAACDALAAILDSGVYSALEENVYRKRYCDMLANFMEQDKNAITSEEFERYLNYLIALERYDDAIALWGAEIDRLRSQASYQSMLAMFYQLKQRDAFAARLDDLRKNTQVRLSASGLEQLRYWTQRLMTESGENATKNGGDHD